MPDVPTQPGKSTIIPELGVSWNDVRKRLEDELRYNPLDMENPPNPIEPKADVPAPMVWTEGFGKMEGNPDGKNSIALLNSIKKWEMELPNMYCSPPRHTQIRDLLSCSRGMVLSARAHARLCACACSGSC